MRVRSVPRALYVCNYYSPLGLLTQRGILKPLMSVRASVRPSVRACDWYRISEMPWRIHLIFYRIMTHISGVMPVFSDFEKNQNWRFYGRFSEKKLPDSKMLQVCSETVLRNGLMDSCETFQQNDQHSRDDICIFRLWEKWKLVILWQFCWWFSSLFNLTCMIVCYLYIEIGFSLLSVCFLRIHKGFICSVFDSMVWFEDYNTIYWMFLDLMHDAM